MHTGRKFAVLVAAVAVVLATTVWLPLYAVAPGGARSVEPLIHVTGHPEYRSQGKFVMTSVEFSQLTALGAFLAWLDPNQSVVSRSEIYAPGETSEEARRRSISQMDQSKLDAAYVVLSELTEYPKDHRPGAIIESVVPGCAADGRLYPGDLIRSIDGERIGGVSAASRAIEAAPSGSSLTFEISAGGDVHRVSLVREPCGGQKEPLVGVRLISNFPFRVWIESGDVGGPSAGLMWSLGLYDVLTPGDLTGGRMIAGTGQIGLDGTIYPIGGIEEKIVAAERAGAVVFLVPQGNYAAARAVSDGAEEDGIELVPVSDFEEALEYLLDELAGPESADR
ncbi:MAG: S16 family serine protease [Actinomycetota bacterium]